METLCTAATMPILPHPWKQAQHAPVHDTIIYHGYARSQGHTTEEQTCHDDGLCRFIIRRTPQDSNFCHLLFHLICARGAQHLQRHPGGSLHYSTRHHKHDEIQNPVSLHGSRVLCTSRSRSKRGGTPFPLGDSLQMSPLATTCLAAKIPRVP